MNTPGERPIRPRGRGFAHPQHLTLLGRVVYQCPGIEHSTLSAEHLAGMTPQACPSGIHADWAVDSERDCACPWCQIDRLRRELAEASEVLRAAHTAAGLVAEYHVPLAGDPDRWLCVRRTSADRWTIRTGQPMDGALRAWSGEAWLHLRDAGENRNLLREYPSADAALDEASRLAEEGGES